jgi:hypothetical protein
VVVVFWVAPAFRGMHVSTNLFKHVMEAYSNRILITNMAPGTMNFYLKTGLFKPAYYKEGMRGFMRFNLAEILPPKRKIFQNVKPLLQVLDFAGNLVNSLRLAMYTKYTQSAGLKFGTVTSIDPHTEEFIRQHSMNELMRRGKAEMEWFFNYPWMMESKAPSDESKRYYFSLIAERFQCRFTRVTNDRNEINGFMILSIRNNHLTVPYYYAEKNSEAEMCGYLMKTMLDMNISMITVFHPELSDALRKSRTPLFLKRKILRPYLCPKELDITSLVFQDGDGDSVFT